MNQRPPGFRHDLLLYLDESEFVLGVRAFVADALRNDATVLALLDSRHTALVRTALGRGADRVSYAAVEDVGRNPARLIPAWHAFVTANAGSSCYGISEPIWLGRNAAEIDEAQRHDALLNLAFTDARDLRILCPYDASALDAATIGRARHSHRRRAQPNGDEPNGEDWSQIAFGGTLAPPPPTAERFDIAPPALRWLRHTVAHRARTMGLGPERTSNLVLAVDEAACNSIRHGGGTGELYVWSEGSSIVCEVRDRGRLSDPLAGRHRPDVRRPGRRGLWLANQLCDLVQLRSSPAGSVVRLSMERRPAPG